MDSALTRIPVDLAGKRAGPIQRNGSLTMVPILDGALSPSSSSSSSDAAIEVNSDLVPPLTGLKLSRVAGYGKVEMECLRRADSGMAIVPLHIGYIQDGAQNHAMCRSGLLAAGQKRMFEDACCVQQTQGGYLEGREQWFFILPLSLRTTALEMRGTVSYGKLWPAITRLNEIFGKGSRGHLDEIVCRERPWLTQWNSRLERIPNQVGALFLIDGKLVGVELAPNPTYFAEVWTALVCFCYGVEAMRRETVAGASVKASDAPGYRATDLASLRHEVEHRRELLAAEVTGQLQATPRAKLQLQEEERLLDVVLSTAKSDHFAGQIVQRRGTTIYASVTATPAWLGA